MKRTLYRLIACTLMINSHTAILTGTEPATSPETVTDSVNTSPFLVILGIAQDAGYPQAACRKSCCSSVVGNPALQRYASCLAIIDPSTSDRWLIDATPDFREQLHRLDLVHPKTNPPWLNGIFLTHAHMGHYTGLMHLGREAMGADGIPVYAMPKMIYFLSNNGPWDQLVHLENISLRPIQNDIPVRLNERLSITPFIVPHRDEYTETVGYRIDGPECSALYIPDIDKWDRWGQSITEMISLVSVVYLDGTFFDEGEIPGRDMDDIPHPFIVESIRSFEALPDIDRSKVRFIHLNHTNPAIKPGSDARIFIEGKGMRVAEEGERFLL